MDKSDIKPNASYFEIRKNQDKPLEWELNRGEEYWEYRKKWEEYPKKQIVSDGPLHLDIETTNICNLKCSMCRRTELINQGRFKTGTMDFDFYSYLIDQSADLNVYSVKYNYLGEPLIHPDIIRQVEYAKRRGIIEVLFNTNATLLTPDMSKKLLDAGLDSIFFSIDSPYPDKYNKIRQGADFNQVIKNIEEFVRIKQAGGYKHVQTRASLVLMDQDDNELNEYKKKFLDLVEIIGFGEYIDRDKDYGADINYDFVCAQPFQRMFIDWDGNVFPCCLDEQHQMSMGNARETALKEIWHNEKYNDLRRHMNKKEYFKLPLCKKCYMPHAIRG